jgi:hypothetical protein
VEETKTKKSTPGWIWILIVVIVVAAGLTAWFMTRGEETEATTETETASATVTATIPDGWKGFTSNKYGFSLSYPSDYTLAEGPTGTIKLTKGTTEMVDMYVYAANGDGAGMMKSQEAMYTDETKGYMIMDEVIQTKVAGLAATTVNGKFGKNAGISQTHEGTTGSVVFFIQDDKQFTFDSYDAGDATARKTFTDILASISF